MGAVDLNTAVLLFSAVVVLALVGIRFSHRLGMPTLLAYLLIGLAIGESGFGIQFSDPEVTQFLSTLLLGLILIDGGFTTRAAEVRPVVALSGILASIGVVITIGVTFALTYLLLDVDVRTALLLGAVVASTDAAATFAVLRRIPMRSTTRAALEAESGFNDPPVIIIVGVVASSHWEEASAFGIVGTISYQLVMGAVAGIGIALLGRWLLSKAALPTAGLYPLAVLAIALGAFAIAGVVGGSGILAGYVAGLVLGNSNLPHQRTTLAFTDGIASLGQIVLFVMLGLLASPSRLLDAVVPALIVGVALTFVARPVTVLLCATPFGVPLREQAFMSWAGLRGAVPIVVATIPISNGIPGAEMIFDVTFLLVVMFTLLQGPSLPWVARLAGVIVEHESHEIEFESAPMDAARATLLQVSVPPGSGLRGVRVEELRLPRRAVVSLLIRDGSAIAAANHLVLHTGDDLLIVTHADDLAETKRRLRAIARGGRLAEWFGESGQEAITEPERPRRMLPGTNSRIVQRHRQRWKHRDRRASDEDEARLDRVPTGSGGGIE